MYMVALRLGSAQGSGFSEVVAWKFEGPASLVEARAAAPAMMLQVFEASAVSERAPVRSLILGYIYIYTCIVAYVCIYIYVYM